MNKKIAKEEEVAWDNYWKRKETKIQAVIYRNIASFYRKFIIKRALNKIIEEEFEKGSKLLHAGSGTGEVDKDLIQKYDITALDISKEALKLYKLNNGDKVKLIHASIFDIPVKSSTFNGVYNLGVMEHFTKEEDIEILKELRRVLKKNGKVVLFWPPKFGISVIFLNSLHFILNNILKRNMRLHPEEVSLIKSKRQVNEILKKSGFKLTKFYFGPLDFFTHCIIVAKIV